MFLSQTPSAENFKGVMMLSIQEAFSLIEFMALEISDLKSDNHRITGQVRLEALLSFKDHQEWTCPSLSGPLFQGFTVPTVNFIFI